MEIGVVAQNGNERAAAVARTIREEFSEEIEVMVDEATAGVIGGEGTAVRKMEKCSFVVSIGGDGTLLFVARQVGETPILGVNLGEVGFLNAVAPADAVSAVRAEIARVRETGTPQFRLVDRLVASGESWSLAPALNEIVVVGTSRGRNNGIDVTVRIGGSVYLDGWADGVLVATQTGSTAYNLSEGGPLVHPSARGVVVTGMAAMDHRPSVVVGPEQDITIEVRGGSEAVVASDGRKQPIMPPCTVRVAVADEPGRIAGEPSDFLEALKKIE